MASLLERDVLGAELIRDKFNMKKMLVAASANGKVSENIWMHFCARVMLRDM